MATGINILCYAKLAVDLFAFSYFTGGINFGDMAFLKPDNIVDGRLVYVRRKTHKLIKLPLQPKALEIIEKYISPFYDENDYIFPILSSFHKTEQQQRNRLQKVMRHINKHLRQIGKKLEIPITLTTYVARHSYAWYESQLVMNGSKSFTYRFDSSTTNVESVLSTYLRTGQTQIWGFTIRTTYSQK